MHVVFKNKQAYMNSFVYDDSQSLLIIVDV